MQVLVTELLVARIVQWMPRRAAVASCLGTLIVPLQAQPAPPPSPVQIKGCADRQVDHPPRETRINYTPAAGLAPFLVHPRAFRAPDCGLLRYVV